MIYLDTSVALAHLLAEDREPPPALWAEPLVASRLLEYELWCRLNAHALGSPYRESAREILARVAMIELSPVVLGRALDPFPLPVRTLDALHLSSIDYLRAQRLEPRLASYDARMIAVARAMGIAIFELP